MTPRQKRISRQARQKRAYKQARINLITLLVIVLASTTALYFLLYVFSKILVLVAK